MVWVCWIGFCSILTFSTVFLVASALQRWTTTTRKRTVEAATHPSYRQWAAHWAIILGKLQGRLQREVLLLEQLLERVSVESEGGGFRGSSGFKEEVIVIDAPAGKLGVVIDTPDDGAPVVHAVKDTSVIADQIQVGDKLIAVDDDDVRSMTAIKVSKLISKKSANPSRRLTIVRTTQA